MNLDQWFADFYTLQQRLEADYKLTTLGDYKVMTQTIHITKPGPKQLTLIKDHKRT
jgi:hypothetical protein